LELKELTEKFKEIFGELEDFNLDLLTDSNCSKYLELINNDLETDYLQKIWQFFMADRENKKQDFTPKSLGKLLSSLTESENEVWVYDMCSGSGALTIQKWCTNKNLKFVCEELDEDLIPFLIFNLKIRNIEGYVINGNVLTGERKTVYKLTKGEKFSEIEISMFFEYPAFSSGISNPPFNLRGEYNGEVLLKNMNFVFILKMLERVKEKAAFILPNGVMGSSEEKEARKYLRSKNKIKAVISNPESMFESTAIPTTVLFFEDSEEISFLNCKNFFTEEERKQNGEDHTKNRVYTKILKTYSDEQIATILSCITEKRNIVNFSKTIKNTEIQEENWQPLRYIETKTKEKYNRSYEDILTDLQRVMIQKNENKLTINETWAKEIGFLEVFENATKSDETTREINKTIKEILKLEIELPTQKYIRTTKSKELKIENMDKSEITSLMLMTLNTWRTMIHFLNNEENRYLSELKDKMLPNLMSGNLKI
jgi:type I restriction-modification system DNA methylase subunit